DGLSLNVSATQMNARLEVDSKYAAFYTPEEIERYLKENNIVFGVQTNVLKDIFREKMFNESILAARGRPVRHGKDGYIDWKVDLSILDGAKLVEQSGRVNWKDQHHILQVEKDELLGRLVEPTEGKEGRTVHGENLPANSGKEAKFPAGKGVFVTEDGKEMYAEITGVVCRDGEKISVSPTYTVQGDVSYDIGNINYKETVVIAGNVLPDFEIRAGQDIHVNGLVEGALLEAGGNIYINGGIQGNQKAIVKAQGDVTVKFINNARVEACRDVIVNGAITNSEVSAGCRVQVKGAKAVIVGGAVNAEKSISASVIGSNLGAKTRLELGAGLKRKMMHRTEQAKKLQEILANYKKLQQAANSLNKLRDAGLLNQEQTALRLKIIRSGLQLQTQIKQMQEEQNVLQEEIEASRKDMKGVAVKEIAWPGAQITILEHQYFVKTQISKAIFALVDKEIVVSGYKEGEKKSSGKAQEKDKKEKENKEPPKEAGDRELKKSGESP
ncbi:MAG: DUF342 domain-containing protein, partial [Candidatus Omnitrophica bacterium]|nr:DUF342 domain-containing protein [Candidatus Omnitrophota bacterium]